MRRYPSALALIGGAGIAEEPAALVAHGGVCEGGGPVVTPGFLYSDAEN